MIELTIEQAKLCIEAIQAYPWEHRDPHLAMAGVLVAKIEQAQAKETGVELDPQQKLWHKKLGA